MKIVFWEKPGCMGNARQRALLATTGREIEAKSLPDHKWTREELEPFLEGLEVFDWFNHGARRVKEGEVIPEGLDAEAAMKILLADPILVRRPLLQIGEERRVGFDLEWIEARIGQLPNTGRIERLRGEDLSSCPGEKTGLRCGDPSP